MKATPAESVLAALIEVLAARYRMLDALPGEIDRWQAREVGFALRNLRRLMQKEGML